MQCHANLLDTISSTPYIHKQTHQIHTHRRGENENEKKEKKKKNDKRKKILLYS